MIELDEGVLQDAKSLAEQHAASGGLGGHVQTLIGVLRRGAKPAAVALAVGALAYLVLTFDAIPDFRPGSGLADDAGILAGAVAPSRRLAGWW